MKRMSSYVVSAALALAALIAGSRVHAQTLEQRIAKLEATVATLQTQLANAHNVLALDPFVSVDPNPENGVTGPHIIFSGANVHIVSGSGETYDRGTPLGRGNLIIGYDEDPAQINLPLIPGDRGGSHNLVIGRYHRFTAQVYPGYQAFALGGLVAGEGNTISNLAASVSGGENNTASGPSSTVLGGGSNRAVGPFCSVLGGINNTAFSNGNGNASIEPHPPFP